MANLITIEQYKAMQGIQSADTRNDAQITALLAAASRAVRLYTGRNFEVNTGISTTRSFQYDGEGMLDIDDCTAVSSLSTDAGAPGQTYNLNADEWTSMPQDDSDVFYYVLIHGGPYFGGSPEMGFERNLDQYPYSSRKSPLVSVTATWGWPVIPEDVQLATAMTVNELVGTPGHTEGITSEAIEGWSRSWAGRAAGGVASLAIPNRARDMLVGYQRIFV
jgi:hypothetical protein